MTSHQHKATPTMTRFLTHTHHTYFYWSAEKGYTSSKFDIQKVARERCHKIFGPLGPLTNIIRAPTIKTDPPPSQRMFKVLASQLNALSYCIFLCDCVMLRPGLEMMTSYNLTGIANITPTWYIYHSHLETGASVNYIPLLIFPYQLFF